ncbi:hypothetical protein DOK78_001874 [Enterococcus sp. DIV2402]|jgi:hypothetical protein|uniref:Uncharacterized protein n=1 Tax=Candidatus Enterococcus lowellii TaxID=2230877 RepID=A0ABZ2SN53_9ENTE|nr:hypothetical protein [Enterococcus sp. DIV2402]MBO0463992.1 hypothetical protein [Enterococcus sp. DIV2402]
MFFQHSLKPKELSKVITNVKECFFVISAKLETRNYHVAVYKYNGEYFVLSDARIFEQVEGLCEERQGDEEELLPYIEEAMEDNLYSIVHENYVRLDLDILAHVDQPSKINAHYYEFIDV